MRAVLRLFAILPVLHELGHGVVGEVLVEVLVVDLNHGGVDAGAQALNLLKGEQTISTGLVQFNAIEILNSLDDIASLDNKKRADKN